MERTEHLGLPLLAGGQAGKELTHNEALVLLDALIGGAVDGVGVDTPPVDAAVGRCWVVGAVPSGAWIGQAGAVACRTAGGWRFVPPSEGLALVIRGTGVPVRYHDGAWRTGEIVAERVVVGGKPVLGAQRPAIADPAGGATVDAEARAALSVVLAALRAHGLIAA